MADAVIQCDALTERQFLKISELVKDLCGINLHQGKKELVKARLNKRLRVLGLANYDEYIELVRRDSSGLELVAMLDALSTNLTSFFREADHFDHLREEVLTRWATGAEKTKPLRIWSAGCSSGEEAYTIAMCVMETLGERPFLDAKILATDLSTQVLSTGMKGVYSKDRLKTLPPQLRSRYFSPVEDSRGARFQAANRLRGLIHFARLNLMESWPMRGPFDVIFCRNVMIYFDKPTQARLVNRFLDLLTPGGGTLYIGHSESLTGVRHRFHYVQPTVYQRP